MARMSRLALAGIVAALTMMFAFALHRGVQPTRRGAIGCALLATGGLGIVLAGIFPWEMVNGVPTETPLHVVGAIMAFAAAGLGFVVISRRLNVDPQWRDLATYTMWTGILVLLLFITVGFFAVDDGAPLHSWKCPALAGPVSWAGREGPLNVRELG